MPIRHLVNYFKRALDAKAGQLAAVIAVQPFGDYGGWPPHLQLLVAGLGVWQAVAAVTFVRYLRTSHCHHCLHFSCVWNRQPPDVVRRWLAKNPALAAGWAGAEETLDEHRGGGG